MHTSVLFGSQHVSPSRRQFLRWGARAAAGLTLAPALLVPAGCSTPAAVTAADPVTHILRARRFRGAPDGREREVWGYDGQLPGPVIRAREGETLRVKVINELGTPTTVHWHGMHQPGTWQMDGVADVSQAPIPAGAEFVYEYKATPAGTHWYHAHVGVQYGNGLFGPLVVDDPAPIAAYDREETLLINDWFWQPGEEELARLLKGGSGKMPGMDRMPKKDMKAGPDLGDIPFQSGLINGKGRATPDSKSPLTEVRVEKGETVRLRLINGSSTYALRFQVDGHPLAVIASDGQPMKPVSVDNLVMDVGETYDVLLKADQEGARWIRAVTLAGNPILAVLRYAGAAPAEPEEGAVQWGPRALRPEDMRSRESVTLAAQPREISLTLGGSMMPYRWSINEQFYPDADPIDIQKDEPVRFVIRNPTRMSHPFHLHGHSFYVLGKPGALNRTDPVLKDTVSVPPQSDLVLQWVANNPGRWFWHCHIEWHMATGMARVVQIKPY
jgi:FtsP/CotA-like multicopper oxidase with cupredoxin domain